MNGIMLVQLRLLSQMRAPALVKKAQFSLGVRETEFAQSDDLADKLLFHLPGLPLDVYTTLLGKPISEERLDDPYRQVVHHYTLPLWPQLRFSVWGNKQGQTGGLGFSAPLNMPTIIVDTPEQLNPWQIVEDQLPSLLHIAKVCDSWYPMKDYEYYHTEKDGITKRRYILRFDFNLLQEVKEIFIDENGKLH